MLRASRALAIGVAAALFASCSEARMEGAPAPTQATFETTGREGRIPAAAELHQLVEQWWPSFSRRIQQQNQLPEAPSRLTGLPQALCKRELPATYECVSLVEYQLASGARGMSLLRHDVSRDTQGRLLDAIIVRETPRPSRPIP